MHRCSSHALYALVMVYVLQAGMYVCSVHPSAVRCLVASPVHGIPPHRVSGRRGAGLERNGYH